MLCDHPVLIALLSPPIPSTDAGSGGICPGSRASARLQGNALQEFESERAERCSAFYQCRPLIFARIAPHHHQQRLAGIDEASTKIDDARAGFTNVTEDGGAGTDLPEALAQHVLRQAADRTYFFQMLAWHAPLRHPVDAHATA